MKRTTPKKLRDRRTGLSPYARYGKRPYTYSAAYHEWRHGITSHTSRVEEHERERHERANY